MTRTTAVAGQFYSASCEEIQEQIKHFNIVLDEHIKERTILDKNARIIISPHAGYVYSGFTANIAHRILANARLKELLSSAQAIGSISTALLLVCIMSMRRLAER